VFGFVAVSATVWFLVTQKNRLIIMLVPPDVARTAGIDVRKLKKLNLLYLRMFALTIALGFVLRVLLCGFGEPSVSRSFQSVTVNRASVTAEAAGSSPPLA
jgi:uncharacterized membrane protein SpoIIM required for sporulation